MARPIIGVRRWSDPKTYYVQDNNPTEHGLKVRSGTGRGWLESCGPTAAVNCLAGLDKLPTLSLPGDYQPQPEQLLCDFFNDPNQFADLRLAWSGLDPQKVAGNEVAEWYPRAVARVFGVMTGRFVGALSDEAAISLLAKGQALQVCHVNPGHFITVLAYSAEEDSFIFNAPWAGRWPDGNGWNRRMTRAEFTQNTKPVSVAYA